MNYNTKGFNPAIAYSEYIKLLFAYTIAGTTAFLMSFYYLQGYFVGDIKFWHWNEEDWLNSLPGFGICITLTSMQLYFYAKSKKQAWYITATTITVCVFFAFMTEIGQGMHRDDIRMTTKSEASPTLKALTGSLSTAATSSYNPYSRDLRKAQMRLASCKKAVAAGTYTDCDESQANVQAVKDMISMSEAANTSRTTALAATAKSMERDENNYHPLVNLIRTQFNWTGIFASFILSLSIIAFFEYGFHYLGRRFSEARDSLFAHGYDVRFLPRIMPKKLPGLSDQNTSEHPQNTHRNTSEPITAGTSTDACSDTFRTPSEHPGTAQETLEAAIHDPEQFAILYRYAIKPVFSQAFLDIATGKIRCTQNGIKKKHNIGGEFTAWIMLLLEVCDIVTPPQGKGPNKIRTLIKPVSWEEGIAALSVILPLIISAEEAQAIIDNLSPDNTHQPEDSEQQTSSLPADETHTGKHTGKIPAGLIHDEVKALILSGSINPTHRAVTDAVTTVIRHKSHLLDRKPSDYGKPQRQQIAQQILEDLEKEGIITRNTVGGVGKPKYILAGHYKNKTHANSEKHAA